ncbi:MAG: hypothetical protein GXP49_09955 [Deltaproteobacteria bacterium]|nr:hypothetical protein [Deltaproteobacteria bacterium]
MKQSLILLLTGVFALQSAGGCFSGNDTGTKGVAQQKRRAELIEQGKELLSQAEPHMAKVPFSTILEEIDPKDPQASFGLGICYLQDTIELTSMLLSVVTGAMNFAGVSNGQGLSENDYVIELIADLLSQLESRLKNSAELFEVAATTKDFSFQIEPGALMYLNLKPALRLGPDLDAADAYLLAYLSRTLQGLLQLLGSQGLNSDIMGFVAKVNNGEISSLDGPAISSALAYLLNSDSRFLTLAAGTGKAGLDAGTKVLANAQRDLLAGMALIKEEKDDQADDAFTIGTTGRGRKKRNVLILKGVWDQEKEDYRDLDITLDNRFETSIGLLASNLEGQGAALSWSEGMMPILDTLLLVVIHENLLAKLGLQLPQELLDSFASMTPEDFGDFLLTLIPDALTIDLGKALGTKDIEPVDLRSLVPKWTTSKPKWENGLIMEYECQSDLDSDGFPSGSLKLFCDKSAELKDSPHFEGTPYECSPDNVLGKFPYMEWPDPSLNGLLMLDMSKSKISGYGAKEGFKVPDNRDLNAFIQKVVRSILFLVGK